MRGGRKVLCPFCRVKGHKTKNLQQCRFSTKTTSRYYLSDNVHVLKGRNLISVLGEGEFYGFYVHRRWGANFGDLNLPHLKYSCTHFSLNHTTGNPGSDVVPFDPSPNTPPPVIEDSNLVVRELLEEIEIECAKQSLDPRYNR
jgi:hypothetical protein